MKAFWAFTNKEIIEYFRSAKLLILTVVFLLFGMMNPVMAKFTPEILKVAGIEINLPDPTAMDSWAQFYKNVSQMGLIIIVIVFSGIMAAELSKGTLINILTKGLKRKTVILSKFTVASVLWTLSYLLCIGVTALYTAYFWKLEGMHEILMSFAGLWLYGELLITLLILGGVLFKNTLGSLFLAGGISFVLTLVSIFPKSAKFNPMTLTGDALYLLAGAKTLSDYLPAFFICLGLIVLVLVVSMIVFDKKAI